MQIIQNIWIQNLFANLHLFYLRVCDDKASAADKLE